jgi:hypothetical protein
VTNKRLQKREYCRGRSAPTEGVMLKLGELAFIKSMSNTALSSVFLRELRNAMAYAKKTALAASKTSARSASALQHNSGVRCEAQTSSELPQPKRKAEEFSSSDCPSEQASRRPAPGHLFADGPTAQGPTGEQAAQCSRQLGPTEGGPAYAVVVQATLAHNGQVGRTSPRLRAQVSLNLLPRLRQPISA